MRARVTRPPKDTLRFTGPATASRCARGGGGGGVVFEGVIGGNGVMVWLRTPDSVAAVTWPVLQRGDTVSPGGATIAARYLVGEIAHGAAMDSGSVAVTRSGRALTLRAGASGVEVPIGRVGLEVTFEAVSVGSDTVSCTARP
jgi:hypothetical protein